VSILVTVVAAIAICAYLVFAFGVPSG